MERLTLGVQQIQGCLFALAQTVYAASRLHGATHRFRPSKALRLIKQAPLLGAALAALVRQSIHRLWRA